MKTDALSDIGACVFDAYGTLFDFNAAAARCRDALGDKAAALSVLWRTKQIEYTWLRSLMGRHADFWQVTGEALDFSLESLGIADDTLRTRLAERDASVAQLQRQIAEQPGQPGAVRVDVLGDLERHGGSLGGAPGS